MELDISMVIQYGIAGIAIYILYLIISKNLNSLSAIVEELKSTVEKNNELIMSLKEMVSKNTDIVNDLKSVIEKNNEVLKLLINILNRRGDKSGSDSK